MVVSAVGLPVADGSESAELSEDVLWLVDPTDSDDGDEVLSGIAEALAADGERHLIGADDLGERIGDDLRIPSGCAVGVEPCGSAEALALEALQVGLLVRLGVDTSANTFEVNYEMVDWRGETVAAGGVEGDDGRRAGFEIVADLFDAVGVVSFESTPEAADVYVDGQRLGTTPMSEQFGLGSYDWRIERDGYEPQTGAVDVDADRPRRVEVELHQRPGRLRVDGAPDQTVVYADGREMGLASEVLELPPGPQLVELRADDYLAVQHTVDIQPGKTAELQVDMAPRVGFLRDVEADAIAAHRLQLEVGLEAGGQMARFPSARTGGDLREEVFGGWLDDGQVAPPADDRRFVTPAGLRLGANWEGDWFGLGLLSVSWIRRGVDESFLLVDRATGDTREAMMGTISSVQIRPMQLRTRVFYENLAPFAQAGFGVDFLSLSAETTDGESVILRQVEPFAAAELGVRYHFDPRWSLGASYRVQQNLAGGTGASHMVGVGVSMGLQQLPFIDPQPPEQL